ncbi:MAG: LysE family translocator [Bacteroidota bacterium]
MNAFFLGILFGFTITLSFGPGFIALFQTSLSRGLNAGIFVATGMMVSDLVLVSLSYFGLSELIPKEDYRILGIVSGIILIIMGGVSIYKKPQLMLESDRIGGVNDKIMGFLVKGFLLNILNPFSLIFWIGLVAFAGKNWELGNYNIFLFFAGVFTTAFTSDILKCYLSGQLRRILASNTIHWITKAMGIVFIGIGLFVIYKVQ